MTSPTSAASFHKYLFRVRDDLNVNDVKWRPEKVREELARAQGSLHAHNAMAKYLRSDCSPLWPQFVVSRGLGYLLNARNLLLPRERVLPYLEDQLSALRVSSVEGADERWKVACLKVWCQMQRKAVVLSGRFAAGGNSAKDFISPKLDFAVSKSKGRQWLCREAVEIGETLLIEAPIACVTFNPVGAHNCSHCTAVLYLPIPCSGCTDVLFCSSECQKAALSTYHKSECAMRLFGILHHLAQGQKSVSCGKAIALRLLTLRPMDFFLQEKALREADVDYSRFPNDFSDDPYAFLWHLYALKRPEDNQSTINSFFELLKSTSWCSRAMSAQEEALLMAVMRRYVKIIEANSFAIDEPKPSTRIKVGSGLYLRASLINHACNPNACFVFRGNRIVIAATSPIEPGEEITISYGFTYPYQGKRSRLLKSLRYDFVCSCTACEENWPSWSAVPTGLIPEKVFDPRKWKIDDVLLSQDLKEGSDGIPAPDRFLDELKSLQQREKKAKESMDLAGFLRVHKDRSKILSPIKQLHFCHHKTRIGVVAALWYKHWFGLY